MSYESSKMDKETKGSGHKTLSTRQLVYLSTSIILFFLVTLPTMAQKETEAKALLEKTTQTFRKAGGIKADFTLTTIQHGMMHNETKGTICLQGEKFRLDTPDIITWFDGKTQWSYLPANEEVNVSTPTKEELQSINPYAFMTLYKQGYGYRIGTTTSYQNKSVHEVILTAEDFERPLSNLTLYIDRTTLLPLYIKLKEAGQDYNVITIGNYQTGVKWGNKDFTFDTKQYPDVEVIDLR